MGVCTSCGGNGGPTAPGLHESISPHQNLTENTRNATAPEGVGNRFIWGTYTMIIDQETHEIELLENRELAIHINVKDILLSDWWCPAGH